MKAQFESRDIANLVARNFKTIKEAYEALDPDGAYDAFVEANEEILASMTEEVMKDWLDRRPLSIYGASETKSRVESLQYAYVLTRYVSRAAEEKRFETALLVLAEASYFSGFSEGLGFAVQQQGRKANSTLNARHAALAKAEKNSAPLKSCFLELLEAESRLDRWNSIAAAVRYHEKALDACIVQYRLPSYPNLSGTMASWCSKDDSFKIKLSQFVRLKEEK